MDLSDLKFKVNNLPHLPGVYLFKDTEGKVVYVGKAKRLKDRVKSYFMLNLDKGSKTEALVKQIRDLEYIEVETELEALILEASLIKKLHPKYNIALKDDKSSLNIVVRNEIFDFDGKKIRIPKVITVRENEILENDIVFGPYAHGNVARNLYRTLRKIFQFRDCSSSKFSKYKNINSPCFYGHIGLCSAPCLGGENITKHKRNVVSLKDLLSGNSPRFISTIKNEMKNLSDQKRFEEAAEKRDLLRKIFYVSKNFRNPEEYINNPYLIEDIISSSLDNLVENIPYLKKIPERIECYDISNLFGNDATGSMVVAKFGRISKNDYRRFRIRFKHTPDDFEMMREVLRRRFKRELVKDKDIEKWGLPNLLVIDGGKGQVSAAIEVLNEYNLDIAVIGLAKREEIIVLNDLSEVILPKDNPGLLFLQKLRDEAHRFAKKYHLQLRIRRFRK